MPNYTPNYNLIKPLGSEMFTVAHVNSNADKIDTAIKTVSDSVNALSNQTDEKLEQTVKKGETYVSLSDFGAIGDYYLPDGSINPEPTDNSVQIQEALDYLFESGGGTLDIGHDSYAHSAPLIVKTVSNLGSYDQPIVEIKGHSARMSAFIKIGNAKYNNLDAGVIVVNGIDLDLNSPFTAVKFNNMQVRNTSNSSTTYAVYAKIGSRLMGEYASFRVLEERTNMGDHDRYSLYTSEVWASSLRDCTFYGDYGVYNASSGTSLLLENTYVRSGKIAYRIGTTYSTLINTCADDCLGVVYDFSFGFVNAVTIGAESRGAAIQVRANNTTLAIGSAYFFVSSAVDSTVFNVNNSDVKVETLSAVMDANDADYLFKLGLQSKLTIERMSITGNARFSRGDFGNMADNVSSANIFPAKNMVAGKNMEITSGTTSGYWDWYLRTPTIKKSRTITGFKRPVIMSDGTNVEWNGGFMENDIFINSNAKEMPVFGWIRTSQTSSTLRDGTNRYIPLVLVGTTEQRPTLNLYVGLKYDDTTLQKTITWWGTEWKDAMGNVV